MSYRTLVKTTVKRLRNSAHLQRGTRSNDCENKTEKYKISSSDEVDMRDACFRSVCRALRRIRNECSVILDSINIASLRDAQAAAASYYAKAAASYRHGHCCYLPEHAHMRSIRRTQAKCRGSIVLVLIPVLSTSTCTSTDTSTSTSTSTSTCTSTSTRTSTGTSTTT
jgi:hypothetical protein